MKNKTIGRVHPEYVGLFLADCEMRLNRAGIYRARILDEAWHVNAGSVEQLLLIINAGNTYRLSVDYGQDATYQYIDLVHDDNYSVGSLNLVSEILLSSHYLQELP